MKSGAFLLLTIVSTYYIASLVQTVFHRLFGHVPRIARLYEVHVKGHHAQYARQMVSDRWIPTEQHIMWYYAVPFIPIVCAAYCLLPGTYFLAHLCGLAFAIWWHIYLHRQYHVSAVWWERFAWFREKRRLHFLHHQKPHKNFAIVEYSWDLLFGTLDEGFPTPTVQPKPSARTTIDL
jgi:sterol desaturase/sphingolipid hydroxylase (fatty acid hydroxylase superfamily)